MDAMMDGVRPNGRILVSYENTKIGKTKTWIICLEIRHCDECTGPAGRAGTRDSDSSWGQVRRAEEGREQNQRLKLWSDLNTIIQNTIKVITMAKNMSS
jgi:hypothetical protein